MTGSAIFVQCGTTHTRAMLVAEGGADVLASKQWRGVSELGRDAFETALFENTADWLQRAPDASIYLNGMAGSTLGWRHAPYVDSPADIRAIATAAQRFEARGRQVVILPGVAGRNAFGEPDVMRGEETEIFGVPDLSAELICVPGTHTKWVQVRGGRIEAFHTTVTGELFALLIQHSVLARGANREHIDEAAYEDGLQAGLGTRGARILHTMFAARVQQVLGEGTPEAAASYLSGLLIGADVSGMLALAPGWFDRNRPIAVIGAEVVAQRFATALDRAGFRSETIDALTAARAGFAAVAAHIERV